MSKLAWWPVRWVILSAIFAAILLPRVDRLPAILWAIGLGLAVNIAIGTVRIAAASNRHRALLASAADRTSANDGELVVIAGSIESADEPLQSPVRREACVLFEFSAFHRARRKHHKEMSDIVDYAGYGISAPLIRGPRFTAPLASFPYLHGFERAEIRSGDAIDAAAEHLRFTPVTDPPQGEQLEHIAVWERKWEGSPRRIIRTFRTPEKYDLAKCTLREHIVPVGANVCAIGIWSSAKNAIVTTPEQDLTLYSGTADQVRETLKGSSGCGLFFAALLILGVAVALIYLLG